MRATSSGDCCTRWSYAFISVSVMRSGVNRCGPISRTAVTSVISLRWRSVRPMRPAISAISGSFMPAVVMAGVPMRRP